MRDIPLAFTIACAAVVAGCSSPAATVIPVDTSTGCNPLAVDDATLAGADLFSSSGTATGSVGGTRVYSWSFLLEHLCTASALSDNSANFTVVFGPALPANVTVAGYAHYVTGDAAVGAIALTRQNGLTETRFTGQFAGFNPAGTTLGAKEGDLIFEVQIAFPTLGTTASDKAFLQPLLHSIEVTTYYHPHGTN
jgi:hypothetical protein